MHYTITVPLFFMFCFLFIAWNELVVLPGYASRDPKNLTSSDAFYNTVYMAVSLVFVAGACYSVGSFKPQLEEAIQLTKVERLVSGESNPAEAPQLKVGSKIWRRMRNAKKC